MSRNDAVDGYGCIVVILLRLLLTRGRPRSEVGFASFGQRRQ